MKRILVATDFSKRSDPAVARAAALAKTHGAKLAIAHIVDDDQSERLADAAETGAGALLDSLSASLQRDHGLAPEIIVTRAEPHVGILRAAKNVKADLIIVGSHRRDLVRSTFVGTTSERSIRSSNIPVLISRIRNAAPYQKPCVALDFSEGDLSPVTLSKTLGFFDTKAARLVFAFEVLGYQLMRRAGITEYEVGKYVEEAKQSVLPEISDMVERAGLDRAQIVLKPTLFSTHGAILEACADEGADLIVVGSRRKKAFDRFRLGSVSETILRAANVDVLVTTPGGERIA